MCPDTYWFQKDLREAPCQDTKFTLSPWSKEQATRFARASNVEENMAISYLHMNHAVDDFNTSLLGKHAIDEHGFLTGNFRYPVVHDGPVFSNYAGAQLALHGIQYYNNRDSGNARPDHRLGLVRNLVPNDLSRGDESDDEEVTLPLQPRRGMREFQLSDSAKVKDFLMSRLKKLQQLVDKKIAKAWIKGICPKKQAKFPYQNKARKQNDDVRQDVPGWWPALSRCRFIEPDHIKRDERMELCIHILTLRPTPVQLMKWNNGDTLPSNSHSTKGWTRFLQELAGPAIFDDLPKENEDRTEHRKLLLEQMYDVAALEEEFLKQGSQATQTTFTWPDDDDERKLTPVKRSCESSTDSHACSSSTIGVFPKRHKSCTMGSTELSSSSNQQSGTLSRRFFGYPTEYPMNARRGSALCFATSTGLQIENVPATGFYQNNSLRDFSHDRADILRHPSVPVIKHEAAMVLRGNCVLKGPAERSAAEHQRKLEEAEQVILSLSAVTAGASTSPDDSTRGLHEGTGGIEEVNGSRRSFSAESQFKPSFDTWAVHGFSEPEVVPINSDASMSPTTMLPSLLGPSDQFPPFEQQPALQDRYFEPPSRGELNSGMLIDFENRQPTSAPPAIGEPSGIVPMMIHIVPPPVPRPEPFLYPTPSSDDPNKVPQGPSWFNRGFTGYGSGVGGGQPT